MLLDKSNVHACAWCMRIGIICVFKENANKTQTIFCRTYPAFFRHSCRTNLALSDISCVFWSFLSVTSSCGHIWLCRTYLAGTRRHLAWRYKLSLWIVGFHRFGSIGRRYDRSWSDGSVALNHDRTCRRRWFIQANSPTGDRAGDSVFAIVFGCFSRIKKC